MLHKPLAHGIQEPVNVMTTPITTKVTEAERAALLKWYGADEASEMEALLASASLDAYEEVARLERLYSSTEHQASKAAARRAAWAILRRARDAQEAA